MTASKVQKKISYLERIRALFKKQHTQQQSGIPKFFLNIAPSDVHWIGHPQNMLPLFQKMILSIRNPQERMAILTNLVGLVDPKKKLDIDDDRTFLQEQIFHAITGYDFTYPIKAYQKHTLFHYTIQNKDFFRLIGMGIRAYEDVSPEKQEKFNKAVMPDVKKQNIAVPYRLLQYVR